MTQLNAIRVAIAALLCAAPAYSYQSASSIEGRVTNAASGDPIRKVNLTLSRAGDKDEPAVTQTDDKGHFAFHDLKPGTYKLAGERNNYQQQEYGSRLNPNAGISLHLASGESISDLVFKLAPSAVISGRVLDQDGEPMPNLLVAALKSSYVNGSRQWIQTGAMQTNDRGEFRISGLRPGRYVISATDLGISIALAGVNKDAVPDKPEPGYASTYFGNTTDMSSATIVDLAMGEDHRGADIRMVKTATLRIRGKVIGAPDDKPLVLMVTRKGATSGGNAAGGLAIVQQKDGAFEVKGLTPGSYVVSARAVTDSSTPVNSVVPVELTDHHLDGFEFRLTEGAELAGLLTMAATKPDELQAVNVWLEMIDFSLPSAPTAKPAADGAFTLKSIVAGTYRVNVEELPENAYVKSVKLNGKEIDPNALDLRAAPTGKLEILVSRAAARIEGTVTGLGDQPFAGATVALIPESRNSSRYQHATTDNRGAFHLTRIAPGKYKVLAWEDIEPGAWQDPEITKSLDGRADSLTIEENGTIKLSLKAIPFSAR